MMKTNFFELGYTKGSQGLCDGRDILQLNLDDAKDYMGGYANGLLEYARKKHNVTPPKPQYQKVTEDMLYSYLGDNTTPISIRAKRIIANLLDSKEFCAKVKSLSL